MSMLFFEGIYFIISQTNLNDLMDVVKKMNFGNISDIVMAIASLSNLIIIIIFYLKDKKYRISEAKKNYKIYWFKEFLLKDLSFVNDFFSNNKKIILQAQKSKQDIDNGENQNTAVTPLFGLYTDSRMKINNEFIDLANEIDRELGSELNNLFEKFQDEFLDCLTEYIIDGNSMELDLYKLVHNQKQEVIRVLYKKGEIFC